MPSPSASQPATGGGAAGCGRRRAIPDRTKTAMAVSEKDRDVRRIVAGDGEVGVAVPVEVADENLRRIGPRREGASDAESPWPSPSTVTSLLPKLATTRSIRPSLSKRPEPRASGERAVPRSMRTGGPSSAGSAAQATPPQTPRRSAAARLNALPGRPARSRARSSANGRGACPVTSATAEVTARRSPRETRRRARSCRRRASAGCRLPASACACTRAARGRTRPSCRSPSRDRVGHRVEGQGLGPGQVVDLAVVARPRVSAHDGDRRHVPGVDHGDLARAHRERERAGRRDRRGEASASAACRRRAAGA